MEVRRGEGCPEWCVGGRAEMRSPHRHVSELVPLAASESGDGHYTARLASGADGVGCEILIDRWERCGAQLRLALGDVDTFLNAIDDDGARAIQELAGLMLRGSGISSAS
jgi:hypothetical protein